MASPLVNPEPLHPNYIPDSFIHRGQEQADLLDLISGGGRNLHLHGPRGTGKTHLVHSILRKLSLSVNTCYVDCSIENTQYKVLKRLYTAVSNEEINTGHHTSDLQRKIEARTEAVSTILVLDEIEFLLLNDGDDLLYFLSRMKNSHNLTTLLLSSQTTDLESALEERVYSSFQPHTIEMEPYSGEQLYDLLVARAEQALKPRSLHREALTYIASTTQNPGLGLHWLKTAAESTEGIITEGLMQQVQQDGFASYTTHLLDGFSEHHKHLYQVLQELDTEQDLIRTGDVYDRYREHCSSLDTEPLSDRRISDYLKHLELLNLITAEYHYGGSKGKTREIQLIRPS